MPSRNGSLALRRRQQAGVAIAGASLALAGAALALAVVGRSRRPSLPPRRHAAEAGEAGLLEARGNGMRASRRAYGPPQHCGGGESRNALAARTLDRAAAILSGAVLADSAVEHYRGMFHDPFMYVPSVVSATVVASELGASVTGKPLLPADGRRAVNGLAILTGIAGTAFHLFNVLKREGGLSWQNLFYAAPIGAPAALTLAGGLGLAAEHLRSAGTGSPDLAGYPAGRALAGFAAFGIAGSVVEAGLFHFRGAFQNPFMLVPVTVPPLAAAALAAVAVQPERFDSRGTARLLLQATAAVGVAGVGFHAYGVSRMMGGWYNWSQNLVDGPPLPAPPSFTGLAVAGLAALDLMEADHG